MEKQAELTTKIIRKSRFKPIITMAENIDGEKIGELVKSNGFNIDVDWSNIHPFWLKATYKDEIIGCVQVLHGRPIGRIEMLAVKETLKHTQKAQLAWRLGVAGMAILHSGGAELACAVVPFTNKYLKNAIKKRGGKISTQGNIIFMRIV